MNYNTIDSAWEQFFNLCLADASSLQVMEMKKAFYMGASSSLGLMYGAATSDNLSEEAAAALFASWRNECDAFVMHEVMGVPFCKGEHNA